MSSARRAARRRGQWSLVGTLVAVAILIFLAAVYLPRVLGHHTTPGGGVAPTPIERANGAGCVEYLSQINQAVQMYKTANDDKPPARLEDLKPYGVGDDIVHAPGCNFQLDPATGAVTDQNGGRGVPGAPGAPPPPHNGGTRGPGGITIPNIPGGQPG